MKKNTIKMMIGLAISILSLSACSGSGGGAKTASDGNVTPRPNSDLQIDYIGMIPILNGSSSSSYFYVHNEGAKMLSGINYALANGVSNRQITGITDGLMIDASDIIDENGFILKGKSLKQCENIAAHSYCAIEFIAPHLEIGDRNNSLLQVTVTGADGLKYQYDQVINYTYYDSLLQNRVNFASSENIIASLEYRKYIQSYLVGGSINNYTNANLNISDTGAVQVNQGFIAGQAISAGQMLPVEFALSKDTQEVYPIAITPYYEVSSLTNGAEAIDSGQSLFINTTSRLDTVLSLKFGEIPILYAPTLESNAATIYISSASTIKGFSVATDGGLLIYANNCHDTILANSSCSLKIGTTATSSGNGHLNFSLDGNQVYSRVVSYRALSTESQVQLVDNTSVSLIGLLANQQSSVINMIFTNIGNAPLTDANFSMHNNSSNSKLAMLNNGCGNLIKAQASCVIQMRLTGGDISESSNFYLTINGKSNSQPYSTTSNPIYYYVNADAGMVISSPLGAVANLSVIGNDEESAEAIFVIQNNGINASHITHVVLSSAIAIPPELRVDSDFCTGKTLAAGQRCNITVKYGPMLLEKGVNGIAKLKVNYTAQDGADKSPKASGTLEGTIKYSGLDSLSYLLVSNVSVSGFSGDGSSASPYMAYGCSSSSPELTITYKNMSGSVMAQNMALNILDGSVPPYLSVNTSKTNCGYGASPRDLAAGASCNLVLAIDQNMMNGNSNYNLNLNYPAASWLTTAGFYKQENFTYSGSATLYADYTQPSMVSEITPSSGASLTRTLTQTISNMANCPALTTKISAWTPFGNTDLPQVISGDCSVDVLDGSVSCNNDSTKLVNVIEYPISGSIPAPATLFLQFNLQNPSRHVWYQPEILQFQLGV